MEIILFASISLLLKEKERQKNNLTTHSHGHVTMVTAWAKTTPYNQLALNAQETQLSHYEPNKHTQSATFLYSH